MNFFNGVNHRLYSAWYHLSEIHRDIFYCRSNEQLLRCVGEWQQANLNTPDELAKSSQFQWSLEATIVYVMEYQKLDLLHILRDEFTITLEHSEAIVSCWSYLQQARHTFWQGVWFMLTFEEWEMYSYEQLSPCVVCIVGASVDIRKKQEALEYVCRKARGVGISFLEVFEVATRCCIERANLEMYQLLHELQIQECDSITDYREIMDGVQLNEEYGGSAASIEDTHQMLAVVGDLRSSWEQHVACVLSEHRGMVNDIIHMIVAFV